MMINSLCNLLVGHVQLCFVLSGFEYVNSKIVEPSSEYHLRANVVLFYSSYRACYLVDHSISLSIKYILHFSPHISTRHVSLFLDFASSQ